MPALPAPVWRSWAGTASASPAMLAEPETVEQLVELVAEVARRGGSLRPVGAGRAGTPLAACDDTMVSLRRLGTGPPAIGPDEDAVEVGAGTRLGALAATLALAGLSLRAEGPADQTIGGALATGLVGDDPRVGSLSAAVEAVQLIDGVGRHSWVEAADLPAARLSLGALGVVTRVRLAVRPRVDVVTRLLRLPLEEALVDLAHHASDHDRMVLSWVPHTPWAHLWLGDEVAEGAGSTPFGRRLADQVGGPLVDWLTAQVGLTRPELVPALARLRTLRPRDTTRPDGRPASMHPPGLRWHAMGMVVDADVLPSAIGALRGLISSRALPALLPIEVRAIPAEPDVWLSPTTGRDSWLITLRAVRGMPFATWFVAAQQTLASFGARPHWGMLHTLTHRELAPRHPRWAEFQAVRARLDPGRVFTAPGIDRLLGPA